MCYTLHVINAYTWMYMRISHSSTTCVCKCEYPSWTNSRMHEHKDRDTPSARGSGGEWFAPLSNRTGPCPLDTTPQSCNDFVARPRTEEGRQRRSESEMAPQQDYYIWSVHLSPRQAPRTPDHTRVSDKGKLVAAVTWKNTRCPPHLQGAARTYVHILKWKRLTPLSRMVCAQKATSRDVSHTVKPCAALNHWRSLSTNDTRAIGTCRVKCKPTQTILHHGLRL